MQYLSAPVRPQQAWLRGGGAAAQPDQPTLVIFPHAGGGASFYRPWLATASMPVAIVQYPGREDRIAEHHPAGLDTLADGVTGALLTLPTRPLCLFGHSMGTAVALEVARRLEARGLGADVRLCVSARPAPHRARIQGVHALADDGIVAHVSSFAGAAQSAAFGIPALRELVVGVLRADYRMLETYRPDREPLLRMPILALGGASDPTMSPGDMDTWSEVTHGAVRSRIFPGGHFYLADHSAAVATTIRQWYAEPAGE